MEQITLLIDRNFETLKAVINQQNQRGFLFLQVIETGFFAPKWLLVFVKNYGAPEIKLD